MTTTYRAGLVLLGLLSLADLSGPLLTDGQHPPMSIALVGAGLGLVSLVLGILAWRPRPVAAIVMVVLRLLSALAAVPAFTTPDVPTVPMILAGTLIGLTLVGSALVLVGLRRQVVPA